VYTPSFFDIINILRGDYMKDKISIGLFNNVRIYVASSKNTVNEAVTRHNLYPVATAALNRTMTATAIMGSMLKNNETVVAIINGGGPLGTIMAEATAQGRVRGYVAEPTFHGTNNVDNSLAVNFGVGNRGQLKIIKDLKLKEPFSGTVGMVSGGIAEEFTSYFAISEQTPSVVALGEKVDTDNKVIVSGGYVLQLMPGHTEEDIVYLEERLKNLDSISNMLEANDDTDKVLKMILPDAEIIGHKEFSFDC
jgi:molecular chaperone Hsp33